MKPFYIPPDFQKLSFKNQFTVTNPNTLNDTTKIYFITEVQSAGAWTLDVIGFSDVFEDPTVVGANARDYSRYTRSGNGAKEFLWPIAVAEIKGSSGITRISGFYINSLKQ